MRKLLFSEFFQRPAHGSGAPRLTRPPVAELATALQRATRRRLGRSLSIREIDAGSCNGCELEIHALSNAYYDVERFGIPLRRLAAPCRRFDGDGTGDQKHARGAGADVHATPDPKWVIALGDCSRDGGCFAGSYAVVGGVFAGRARRSPYSRAARHRRWRFCADCSPCSIKRRKAPRPMPEGDVSYLVRSSVRAEGFDGLMLFAFGFGDMLPEPNTTTAGHACNTRIDQFDPGIFQARDTSFISESTLPRITPSLASMRWMVGTERSASLGGLPLIDVEERTAPP